jgi:ribosome-associated protein
MLDDRCNLLDTLWTIPAASGYTMTDSTPDGLLVTSSLTIPRAELSYRATRAGGAGGQHVNTSSTRIELLWDVEHSSALTDELRDRLRAKLASRITTEGMIRVVASERRSQSQNRAAADERLADLVRRALAVPKKRKATKPSRAAKEKRLSEKKRHSERKKNRRGPTSFD